MEPMRKKSNVKGGCWRSVAGRLVGLAGALAIGLATSESVAQTIGWTQKVVSGPAARSYLAMAYDSDRGVTVLFGGAVCGSGPSAETWEWNGTVWTLRATTGPSARIAHGMAYDSTRHRTVLFGGGTSLATPYSAETWEWSGTAWTLRATTGPSARILLAMAYDSARGRTVLFGGWTGPFVSNGETWEWNGTTWTQRVVSGPPARASHAMAYDSVRHVTVLFGGFGLGDTWEWNGTNWTQRVVTSPSARAGHAMAYDSIHGATVLFGGDSGGYSAETWEWNGTAWTQQAVSGPSARVTHTLAYDGARDATVLFGGEPSDGGCLGDTWVYTSPTQPGACCFTDGSCTVLTQAGCIVAGGTYQGNGTTCTPNPCRQSNDDCAYAVAVQTGVPFTGTSAGATGTDISSCGSNDSKDVWNTWMAPCMGTATFSLCDSALSNTVLAIYNACPPTGTEVACNDDAPGCGANNYRSRITMAVTTNTTYWIRTAGTAGSRGAYTLLVMVVCNSGACCFGNGSCQVLSPADCTTAGGSYQGDATVCEPNPCSPPTAACCYPDGSCAVTTQANCTGIWHPAWATCSVAQCPPPTGSCCYPDGSCAETLQAGCSAVWTMFGTCTPNTCQQPEAACCFSDGGCQMLTAEACTQAGGSAGTYGSTCMPNDCPQPTAACCYPDGTCAVTTQTDCTGIWHPEWADCGAAECEQPPVACCFANGMCQMLAAAQCTAAGGTPDVYGSDCTPNECPPRVGDLSCDGSVNFKDINPFVLYLSNFSGWRATYPDCPPENGDINGDGTYPSFRDINPFVALLSGGG